MPSILILIFHCRLSLFSNLYKCMKRHVSEYLYKFLVMFLRTLIVLLIQFCTIASQRTFEKHSEKWVYLLLSFHIIKQLFLITKHYLIFLLFVYNSLIYFRRILLILFSCHFHGHTLRMKRKNTLFYYNVSFFCVKLFTHICRRNVSNFIFTSLYISITMKLSIFGLGFLAVHKILW